MPAINISRLIVHTIKRGNDMVMGSGIDKNWAEDEVDEVWELLTLMERLFEFTVRLHLRRDDVCQRLTSNTPRQRL